MVDDLIYLSVDEARALLDRREVSSVELTEAYLRRIDAVEEQVRAFITLTPNLALAQAREADRRIDAGQAETFTGIPIVLKDVLCTADAITTAGSQILRDFRPPYDATAVARLRAQGAVFLGKTNTDEFAMGSSTENSAFHTTHNPWDPERVPGGSSGGSIAAVAAGEALVGLGSETGGSVRQPAGFCGIVGLKTTYGRISRYGLIAFASSLDQIGPATRSVADCAHLLGAIAGYDPNDSTSAPEPVPDYRAGLTGEVRGVRIGVPREYFQGLQPGVHDAVNAALGVLVDLGAELIDISLPTSEAGLPVYYIVSPAEASANLARYDGIKYGHSVDQNSLLSTYLESRRTGFGAEVKRRIMLGTYALSSGYYDAYYVKAQQVRTLIKAEFDRAFGIAPETGDRGVDVIVGPTSPTVAFRIGERSDDPLAMYMADILTIPANLAGIPSVAVPCGFADGLPVSLQIMGPAFAEALILRVGDAYERATDWSLRHPPLDTMPVGG